MCVLSLVLASLRETLPATNVHLVLVVGWRLVRQTPTEDPEGPLIVTPFVAFSHRLLLVRAVSRMIERGGAGRHRTTTAGWKEATKQALLKCLTLYLHSSP